LTEPKVDIPYKENPLDARHDRKPFGQGYISSYPIAGALVKVIRNEIAPGVVG
jgi:hypothetical protein